MCLEDRYKAGVEASAFYFLCEDWGRLSENYS